MADNEIRPECKVTFANIHDTLKRIEAAQTDGFKGTHGRLDKINGQVAKHGNKIAQHDVLFGGTGLLALALIILKLAGVY